MNAATLFLLVLTQGANTDVVVPNASFERAAGSELPGWRKEGPWEVLSEGKHGKQAIGIPATLSRQWQKVLQTGYVEVAPGERLTLSVWYRSTTGDVDAGLEFCDEAGRHVKWGSVQRQGISAEWKQLRREFTIGDDLVQQGVCAARIYLQVTKTRADAAFDRVQLVSSRPIERTRPAQLADPLRNPGFELGAGDVPRGWAKVAHGRDQEHLVTWARKGRRGRSLQLSTGGHGVAWHSGPMRLDTGMAYALSLWVRTREMHDSTAHVALLFRDASGRAVIHRIQSGSYCRNVDWHEIKLDWEPDDIGELCGSVELTVAAEGSAPGSAWFDDLSLRPVPVKIAAQCVKPNGLLVVGQPKRFRLDLRSFGPKPMPRQVHCAVRGYWGKTLWQHRCDLAWADRRASVDVEPLLSRPGYYELTASCAGTPARAKTSFAIVETFDPSVHVDESPFGSHWTSDAPGARTTAREGYVKWIRRGIGWAWIERKPGQFDWASVDSLIEGLASEGLRLYPVLSNTPKWASTYTEGMPKGAYRSTHTAYPPRDMALFGRFTWQVARRYRDKLPYYEIWNEPNGSFFMGTNEEFAQVLREGYKGLKLADPDCRVMFDTANTDFGFYEDIFRYGAGEYFDILATHNYQLTHPGPPEAAGFFEEYVQMRDLLARHGRARVPIWDSEFCWMSATFPGTPWWKGVGEVNQADWLVRSYAYAVGSGCMKLFWFPFYPYYDRSTSGYHPGSLVRRDLTPKPAFVTFRTMASQIVGWKFLRWLDVGENARCAVFHRAGEQKAVAWAVGKRRRVGFSVERPELTIVDAVGGKQSLNKGETFELTLRPDPIYILGAGRFVMPAATRPEPTEIICPPISTPTFDGDPRDWIASAYPIALNTMVALGDEAAIVNDPAVHDFSGSVALARSEDAVWLGAEIHDDDVTGRETIEVADLDGRVLALVPCAPGQGLVQIKTDVAGGQVLVEARLPLNVVKGAKQVAVVLTDVDADGETHRLRSPMLRLILPWRAADGSYPQHYDMVRSAALPGVDQIVTRFPAGKAFQYQILAWADKAWSPLTEPRAGRGAMLDHVSTKATRFRTRLTNLLSNSSFEQPVALETTPGLDKQRGAFGVWQRDQPYCIIDKTVAHTGRRSAKIMAQGRDDSSRWSNWGQTIRVKPNTTYSVSGYVKLGKLGPKGRASLAIHGYPADSQKQLSNHHCPVPRDRQGWQRIAFKVTTAPGVTRLRVWCDIAYNGAAWFDDVHVIEGDLPTDVAEILTQEAVMLHDRRNLPGVKQPPVPRPAKDDP